MLQNNRKAEFSSMWLTMWRKRVYVNIYPLIRVFSKTVVLTNPNFPYDLSFFKYGKKKNFLSISVPVSEIVTFMSKKKSSL